MKKIIKVLLAICNFFLIIRAQTCLYFYKGQVPPFKKKLGKEWKSMPEYSNISLWRNGWYVNNGGNDDRQLCIYSPNPSYYEGGKFRIRKKPHLPDPYKYAAVMKYSSHQFSSAMFSIVLTLNEYRNAKPAVWLKAFHADVKESDVIECSHNRYVALFRRMLVRVIFTVHGGTSYQYDHWQSNSGLWLRLKPHRFTQIRRNGRLYWYVNNYLIRVLQDPHDGDLLGLILNYFPIKHLQGSYAEIEYRDIVVKYSGRYSYDDKLKCPACGKIQAATIYSNEPVPEIVKVCENCGKKINKKEWPKAALSV